jgi:hypothetical protein
VKAKEVLTPPRTYEYNDTSIQPNYLNTTTNQQVGNYLRTCRPGGVGRVPDRGAQGSSRAQLRMTGIASGMRSHPPTPLLAPAVLLYTTCLTSCAPSCVEACAC